MCKTAGSQGGAGDASNHKDDFGTGHISKMVERVGVTSGH